MTHDTLARFLVKVVIDPDSQCWLWQASKDRDGYAAFQWKRAHRIAYVHYRGPITFQLDHLCRIRHCVNPWHLDDVQGRTNRMRGDRRSGHGAETHCPQGHPYSGENLIGTSTHRLCRECTRHSGRERSRQYRLRKKATA